ncbi:MAG: peptide chain release factor N(5)-glutamine methyltransferase [Pseudomonadota bacterium]
MTPIDGIRGSSQPAGTLGAGTLSGDMSDTTLSVLTTAITGMLQSAGVEEPRREARRIIIEVLALDPAKALANPGLVVAKADADVVVSAVNRRLAGEPLSRIIAQRDFFGRTFQLSPDTLDPRPDTETLVELALERAGEMLTSLDKPIRILDIGTGTGCIAITLALELPAATVVATDISSGALQMAKSNANRLGVGHRLTFIETDGIENLSGPFDLVVSNPPYIRTSTLSALDAEVRDHDPLRALDGGPDGLAFYRSWIKGLAALAPEAAVVFEVGAPFPGEHPTRTDEPLNTQPTLDTQPGSHVILAELTQEAAVSRLLFEAFGRPILKKKDLNGHIRCVAIASAGH